MYKTTSFLVVSSSFPPSGIRRRGEKDKQVLDTKTTSFLVVSSSFPSFRVGMRKRGEGKETTVGVD